MSTTPPVLSFAESPAVLPVPLPVWILENETAVRYLGVRFVYKREEIYHLFSSHNPSVVKRVLARDVYYDERSALNSLARLECWYVLDDKIVPANGYCKDDGTLVAFDRTTNARIWHVEIFPTLSKAQRWAILSRRNERRRQLRKLR